MIRQTLRAASAALFVFSAAYSQKNPEVASIVSEISQDRIAASMKTLAAFGTRGNFTDPNDPKRGIGAARKWIYDQFRSYSPNLEVSYDSYKVKGKGRIFRDVDVVNVIAVLPGTTQSEHRVLVSGHYDSLNIVLKPGVSRDDENATDATWDNDASAIAPAPGVTDDASGVAVVLELARVMSKHKFAKTVVFAAFAGEEIGLVGSSLYAENAKKQGELIDAVFNNDIVGSDDNGHGYRESGLVHVFSDDPADSPSRELARYVRECAFRYVPGFTAQPVFRADRFARGGDHSPFLGEGYAGIRFTSAAENLTAQHTAKDTFEIASPSYTANVARVNGAALASLALAPPAPDVAREIATGTSRGRHAANLSRGKERTDAVLKWQDASSPDDLSGYAIVMRSTTDAFWQHELFVGKVNEYTLPGVDIDDVVLGVKAIGRDGAESPVSAYVASPFPRQKIELLDSSADK